jgi:hypothetical protein
LLVFVPVFVFVLIVVVKIDKRGSAV